jgi:hypothetical protein
MNTRVYPQANPVIVDVRNRYWTIYIRINWI